MYGMYHYEQQTQAAEKEAEAYLDKLKAKAVSSCKKPHVRLTKAEALDLAIHILEEKGAEGDFMTAIYRAQWGNA